MFRINDKRFLILGFTIVIASVFLGISFASQYKSLNIGAVVKSGNACYDKCRIEKGRKYCNSDCGTDINYLGGNNNVEYETNYGTVSQSGCAAGEIRCSVTNQKGEGVSICASISAESCNEAAIDQGISVRVGSGSPGDYQGGWICKVGVNGYISGPCLEGNRIPGTGSYNKPPSCFCGVIQIDGGDYDGTYKSECGCDQNDEESNPTPNPTPTVTPTTTPVNTPSSTPTATPTNSPTPTSTPIPTATSTGAPNYCGGTCGSNSNCQGNLFCFIENRGSSGFCRNPQCAQEADCSCKSTLTPPPVLGQTAPPVLPKTGGSLVMPISLIGIMTLGIYLFRKFKLI